MLDFERHIAFDPPENSPQLDWFCLRTTDDAVHRSLVLSPGEQARRFLFGMHAAVVAFVSFGNNLIFDDVLYDPAFLENYLRLFNASQVFLLDCVVLSKCWSSVNTHAATAQWDMRAAIINSFISMEFTILKWIRLC